MRLIYRNKKHEYWFNGKKCSGVSTTAKIVPDTFLVENYDRRMVAIGVALDPNLVQNIAMDLEDIDAINEYVTEAKRAAKAHLKADRGTQKHRVLEYILVDQEDKLITDQQREDAVVLKRTMDRYHLVPHENLVEQFVLYPDVPLAGRFDAVFEKPDGSIILVDLKSGVNAINYPQTTTIQLAFYANAPHVSLNAPRSGDKQIMEEWREMPERLDKSVAWVMLVENDTDIGTLHPINIEHGWAGAQLALECKQWRKQLSYGDDITWPVTAEQFTGFDYTNSQSLTEQIAACTSLTELRATWEGAVKLKLLTSAVRKALEERASQINNNVGKV